MIGVAATRTKERSSAGFLFPPGFIFLLSLELLGQTSLLILFTLLSDEGAVEEQAEAGLGPVRRKKVVRRGK